VARLLASSVCVTAKQDRIVQSVTVVSSIAPFNDAEEYIRSLRAMSIVIRENIIDELNEIG
jgi:hypothetical protein